MNLMFKSCLTSGISYVFGDLTAQIKIEKKEKIDFNRTLKFSLIGFIWVGPYARFCLAKISEFSRIWYKKIILDQTFLMPPNMAVVNLIKPLLDHNGMLSTV